MLLLAIGGGGLSVALGAWGHAAPTHIVDREVVRWWQDGGWKSFASVSFIGLVLFILGLVLARAELVRHGGVSRLADFELARKPRPGGSPGVGRPVAATGGDSSVGTPTRVSGRGATVVRAEPVGRALEADLEAIDGVQHASVSLFGRPSQLQLRARLDIGDGAELAAIGQGVDRALERLVLTAGLGPEVLDVTLALVPESGPRIS